MFPRFDFLSSAPTDRRRSHAIAGGFSPAIATALYTNYGLTAASMVYVIFGSLSVMGIYINYFCGGNDKEADTGAKNNNNGGGSVEMQENGVVTAIDDDGEAAATKDTTELV